MRRGVHRSAIVAAGLGIAVGLAALAYGATDLRSKPVRFSSVLSGTIRTVPSGVRFAGDQALVLPRITDVTYVIPYYLGDGLVPRLEKTQWSRSFLVVVVVRRETTGYEVRVKKISFQRIEAGLTQFCVIASIRKPGPNTAVERKKTTAYHVVAIARAGFGLSFTPSAVLRDSTGKLLSRGSSYPTRSGRCRA